MDAPDPTTTDPTPAPAPQPAPAPAPAPTADADPYEAGAGTFDRAYVEKLRQESARYRTERNSARDEAGRFTSAFDGLDDATRETLLALPQALKNDPKGTAQWMRDQAEAMLAADQGADPREGEKDEDRPLTKKEVDAILADRDKQAAVSRELDNIRAQIKSFGVDPDSKEATAIMALAASHFNADVAAAYKEMAGWAQAAVDQYVGGKKTAAAGPQPVPPAGQAAGAAVEAPKTFKDADRAAMAHIAAVRGTPGQ